LLLGPLVSRGSGKRLGNVAAKVTEPDLRFLAELLEAGKIKPVIDRCYPLPEAVEAFRYLGAGHARGKIVITI